MSLHRMVFALVATFLLGVVSVGLAQESWLDHPLTDVGTGETFTLSDFDGQALLVETMATWCGNCRRQLGNLRDAREALASAGVEVTYVVVSVERGLADAALAAYAERHEFPFRFAVADDTFVGLLADRFSRTVLNPPSTPHVIVTAEGSVSELMTGFSAPDELVALLSAAAN